MVNFYVCGNEVLSLASSASHDHSAFVSSSDARIPLATYEAWFALDVSAANAVTDCGVNNYELFESDSTPAVTTTAVAASVAYVDSATSDLLII